MADGSQPLGDPAVWTVLGEAGANPAGQIAVASTVANRQTVSGAPSAQAVVTDPTNGYEAWQNAGARARVQQEFPAGSPAYVAAQNLVGPILDGSQAAPLPYDSFYSPKAQKALGRPAPKWDDGSGVNVGGNLFFAGKYTPQGGSNVASPSATPSPQAIMAAYGWAGAAPAASGAPAAPAAAAPDDSTPPTPAQVEASAQPVGATPTNTKTLEGKLLNDAQQPVYAKMLQSGQLDYSQPAGSPKNPMWATPGETIAPAGAYYVDLGGQVHSPDEAATDGPPSPDAVAQAYGWPGAAGAPPNAAPPASAAQPGIGGQIWNGLKTIGGNFLNDYQAREQPAAAALGQDAQTVQANAGTVQGAINASPLSLSTLKTAGDAANYLLSPIMAAGDTIVGRPGASAINAGANAVGVKTNVTPQQVTNVASVVAPLAEGVNAERAIATGAKALDITPAAYEARVAQQTASANASAANSAAAAKAAKTAIPQVATPQSFDFSVGRRTVQLGDTSLQYRVAPDGSVNIDQLTTADQARGQGSARAALNTFLAATDQAGHTVTLSPVPMDDATNGSELQRFYQSQGFQWTGNVRPDEYEAMARGPQPVQPPAAPRSPGIAQNALTPAINAAKTIAAPVTNAFNPFIARASQGAAEAQAGKIIASNATDLPAVRASIANGADEIVPGSTPTTFQQTGDVGLGSLERSVATQNPAAFATVRGDQNAARVGALANIQAGADPADVSAALKANFAATDAQTAAHVDQLTQTAQQTAASIGGTLAPESYGAVIRDAVTTAEDATRQREGALWQAVDPDGTLTGNVAATKQAATDIASSVASTAKPMSGEEGAIFDTASNLPPVAPLSDLVALRSRVSTEMRNELVSNGRSPTYARLSQLRGAIEGNLSDTIADQVASDTGTASGTMADDDTIGSRVQRVLDGWAQQGAQARTGTGGEDTSGSGVATSGVPGVGGAGGSTSFGPGNAPGNPSLPISPTVDAGAAARLAAANDATKERAATFGVNPVSNITATAGGKGQFRLPDGSVPGAVFKPGPAAFTGIQRVVKAGGPDALGAVQDYAAMSLRRTAMNDDGTLDPAKFARWQSAHADALRALPPETSARFNTAAQASDALAEAASNRAVAIKNAQAGAVGKILKLPEGQPVGPAIGQILEGRTGQADMASLAKATAGNADASAGLRQAVVDHIMSKYIGNTEAGASGQNVIKADQFQTFVRKSKGALGQVFTPHEVANIEAVGADINRSNRSVTAIKLPGGPATAQDTVAVAKHGESKGIAHTILDMVGVALGHHLHLEGGAGEMIGLAGGELVNGLRQAGINRVDELVTRGMLDPNVARVLLSKVPGGMSQARTADMVSGRGKALLKALQVGGMVSAVQPVQRMPQPAKNALLTQ